MKKKLFSFIIAFAFILTAGICLTACGGGGHKTFDMFNKIYKISSTATYELTIGNSNQKITDWEGYIRNNYANIADKEGEYNSAETLISHLQSRIASYKFIKGATLTIGEGQIEGEQKVGSLTITQGDMAPITLQVKANPNKEYKDEYTNGILYIDENYCGEFVVSCNAKAEILEVGIRLELNETEYVNEFRSDFELKDGTSCYLEVAYNFYK